MAARGSARDDAGLKAAEQAYEAGQYAKAEQLLQTAASAEPQNAEIQLLLTKTHLEVQQWEAAIKSAERGVALEPKSSVYHEWLGRAYGERADHASFMTALGFAKKTRKEFETAVELDGNNFTARQAVIEFDCAAPAIAGGGEDKAQPEIAQMAALDAAEGAYAKANCRRQKKDFADDGRGIHQGAANRFEIRGARVRYRRLCRASRRAGDAFGSGRFISEARAKRPTHKVLSRSGSDFTKAE